MYYILRSTHYSIHWGVGARHVMGDEDSLVLWSFNWQGQECYEGGQTRVEYTVCQLCHTLWTSGTGNEWNRSQLETGGNIYAPYMLVGPCHHLVIWSSGHHIILSPCHLDTLSSCSIVILPACQCQFVNLFQVSKFCTFPKKWKLWFIEVWSGSSRQHVSSHLFRLLLLDVGSDAPL